MGVEVWSFSGLPEGAELSDVIIRGVNSGWYCEYTYSYIVVYTSRYIHNCIYLHTITKLGFGSNTYLSL